MIEIDVESSGQFDGGFADLQSHGQHQHIEDLFLHLPGFIREHHLQIAGFRIIGDGVHPGLDKADAFLVPGPIIIFFIIFAKRADIHVKNSAVQITSGMFLGDHGILDGVHTADRTAVSVAASVGIP